MHGQFYRHNVGAKLVFTLIRAITRIAPTKKQYNHSLKARPNGAKFQRGDEINWMFVFHSMFNVDVKRMNIEHRTSNIEF